MKIDKFIKESGYYKASKSILLDLFIKSGANSVMRRFNRTPRILFWHGVDINPNPIIEPESINKNDFIKQLDYLQKYYEIISIDEFYKRFIENNFNGKEVTLTFDDGYKNNLTILAPFLKERNLPFTVFISTSNISSGKLFYTSILRLVVYASSLTHLNIDFLQKKFSIATIKQKKQTHTIINKYLKESPLSDVKTICDELISNISTEEWDNLIDKYNSVSPLTWDEVRKLQTFNCTIGSHCIQHMICHSNQKEEDIKEQIIKSKEIIEKQLGVPCNYFAYPNGDYTNISNKYVKLAGYLMGFSVNAGCINPSENNISALPRFGSPFNLNSFKIAINILPKNNL